MRNGRFHPPNEGQGSKNGSVVHPFSQMLDPCKEPQFFYKKKPKRRRKKGPNRSLCQIVGHSWRATAGHRPAQAAGPLAGNC
jgi:hypothetical protein